MASSNVSSQGTESVQTTMTTSSNSSNGTTAGSTNDSGTYQFNIGLVFCESAANLSEATSWVISTNAATVDFMVQWESDIMDENNEALDAQIDIMGQYTSSDDSGKLNIASTTYTQMSQEAQDQTNQMSSEQTTLNQAGENEMSFSQSFNSMAAQILSGLDYLKNLL